MTLDNVHDKDSLKNKIRNIGEYARNAAFGLASTTVQDRRRALNEMSLQICDHTKQIKNANDKDIELAHSSGLNDALLDRLKLDEERILAIARGLIEISKLDDPLGRVLESRERPNGLNIQRVSVPIGVIAVIYESRPNVTADAGGLCLMSGNVAILRGGSESFYSSEAIVSFMHAGLREAGLSESAIQLVPMRDRAAVGELLKLEEFIDMVVPRGGKSLIERVREDSRIPVLAHLEGICHTYIHAQADLSMAKEILLNAKMRRTGICGATETLLVDTDIAQELPVLIKPLVEAGCELRGDTAARVIDSSLIQATESDWKTEYLDAVLSIRVVNNLEHAIEHINRYGSHHTDSIVTNNELAAEKFMNEVDSGIVMHNTSTQFADGAEFGMGAEIGIATGKLHARGPVGIEQLTTYKYKVQGQGQVRP
tara:strand:- start:9228 stop:10508 length:1281 start_codon:yes stop_codon:yes gene_type:complete